MNELGIPNRKFNFNVLLVEELLEFLVEFLVPSSSYILVPFVHNNTSSMPNKIVCNGCGCCYDFIDLDTLFCGLVSMLLLVLASSYYVCSFPPPLSISLSMEVCCIRVQSIVTPRVLCCCCENCWELWFGSHNMDNCGYGWCGIDKTAFNDPELSIDRDAITCFLCCCCSQEERDGICGELILEFCMDIRFFIITMFNVLFCVGVACPCIAVYFKCPAVCCRHHMECCYCGSDGQLPWGRYKYSTPVCSIGGYRCYPDVGCWQPPPEGMLMKREEQQEKIVNIEKARKQSDAEVDGRFSIDVGSAASAHSTVQQADADTPTQQGTL